MFTLLVLLSQLPTVTLGFPHCARGPKASKHAGEEDLIWSSSLPAT
uniref:Proline rich Gla 4 (Transmembrane) isoform 2 n=1 Tax=Homo sapiens TaxID=9606 RepID=A0A0S2Z5T7_HUMAN|nr:proline rich Gla 4 (transmembrane) isoform 2 [Homo sapiens]